MQELYQTAHSAMTDPAVHVWGWEVAVYLFLGGWTAGILILSGWALSRGRAPRRRGGSFALASSYPFLLGLVAVSLGMLALFLDLEHKLYVWRLYLTFEPWSPMSWGSWILLLIYPVLLAGVLVDPPAPLVANVPGLAAASRWLFGNARALRALGWTAVVSGVALGIYTGILLSALGARPLWSSALLGPLFLVSGLSAGAAFGHLTTPDPDERVALAKADNIFLVVKLALLGLLLVGLASSTRAHAEAAALVLGGPYTAFFWAGIVGLGIVVPLAIQSLAVTHRVAHTPVAPVMVMLGGLALRFLFVYAGQASHWPRL
jgi:protein NrfD